jgi:hypothetical protein
VNTPPPEEPESAPPDDWSKVEFQKREPAKPSVDVPVLLAKIVAYTVLGIVGLWLLLAGTCALILFVAK